MRRYDLEADVVAEAVESVHIQNNKAIEALSRQEIEAHFGEYAILVNGRIVSYHPTNREALTVACKNYSYGQFSVQRIEPQPVELGFADFATYPR